MWRRNQEAAQRFQERRQREDGASRLSALVPNLATLSLEVQETRSGISNPEATHIRRIVVEHAPALFVIPCHDSNCKDGGHDITSEILSALRGKKERFEGEDGCPGMVGSSNCPRVLRYVAVATYRDAAQRATSGSADNTTERPPATR